MNPQKRAGEIEHAALRAAQKAMRTRGGAPLTRAELLQLRVQSTPLWKRVVIAIVGAGVIGGGLFSYADDYTGVGTLLMVAGMIIFLIGLIGRRHTFDALLQNLDSELANVVIEAVVNALDGP